MAGRLLNLCLAVVFMSGVATQVTQDTINYMSNNLAIHYDVINNVASDETFQGELTFTNEGNEVITRDNWSINFCHIRMMEPESLPDPEGVVLGETGLRLFHVNGCQFRLTPTADFKDIPSDGTLNVPFVAEWWQAARSDIMPNWYIWADGLEERTLVNTATESLNFVGEFDTENKWKRSSDDKYNPYTPNKRYDMYKMTDLNSSPLSITPKPLRTDLSEDSWVHVMNGDWVIVPVGEGAEKEATFLAELLRMEIVSEEEGPSARFISVHVNGEGPDLEGCSGNGEAYSIQIIKDTEHVNISSQTTAGVFYGIQTFLALLDNRDRVPTGTIEDCPRYGWRGMHLDVARHFSGKESVLKILDVMAMYKLNKFHFHLSDDEGWRLEIPSITELAEIGGTQCHTTTGDDCIIPQFGSGPGKATSGSGYYTMEDYQEILHYANTRHIQVIPEFDMPGHAHAAINAMNARYRKYIDTNETKAMEFLLADPEDNSTYLSIQMFTDNAVNPCIDSTYKLVDQVIDDLIKMHSGIQDLEIYHFGGDEVPETAWLDSPSCQSLMEQYPELNTTKELKKYFVQRVSEISHKKGLDLAGWEDGYTEEDGSPFNISFLQNDHVYSNVWNNIWEWGSGSNVYVQANAGYKMIISHATHLYFDHPQEPDPEERGFYWATRVADTEKTFGYMPDRVYDNIDISLMGDPLSKEDICEQYECPELEHPENIVGIQGQLWSETVRTEPQLYDMIFPRLLALAERAWHKASWEDMDEVKMRWEARDEDWQRFANALGHKELRRLDEMGITYHLRPPGLKSVDNSLKLEANAEFPGLPVQFSTDEGATWSDYKIDQMAEEGIKYTWITRSADRSRHSRTSLLVTPVVSGTLPGTACNIILVCAALISSILQFIL